MLFPISSLLFTLIFVPIVLNGAEVVHNLLASDGIDGEELYISRPLTAKEWEEIGAKYIRTTVNGKEKYKIEMGALDFLDKLAKIGYQTVGMTNARIGTGKDGLMLMWILRKEL